ncbi:MAG: LysR family transcriptional regulator [Alphaproteobacteria bacterium]|nr:LysR family transcriptional regulator [Alphaproteobacteria bacterium]
MSRAHNLNRLAYFAAVVETGSFTKAAERLGVTKAVVSSQVTQLESELQATLLVRNTRRVSATEAGQVFYARCATILGEAEEAFGEISDLAERPVGILRMTAPNDYGTAIVAPVAADFRRQYPGCRVELRLTDDHSDLMAGDLDLAIRVGWLRDSGLMARKMGIFKQVLVGPGADAARLAALQHPNELANCPFIANAALPEPLRWRFEEVAGRHATVVMESGLSINGASAIMEAVKNGAGLAILPDYLVRKDLVAGHLTMVLPDWRLPEGGIHAVLPASKFRAAKVTAFIHMLLRAERERSADADRDETGFAQDV